MRVFIGVFRGGGEDGTGGRYCSSPHVRFIHSLSFLFFSYQDLNVMRVFILTCCFPGRSVS